MIIRTFLPDQSVICQTACGFEKSIDVKQLFKQFMTVPYKPASLVCTSGIFAHIDLKRIRTDFLVS